MRKTLLCCELTTRTVSTASAASLAAEKVGRIAKDIGTQTSFKDKMPRLELSSRLDGADFPGIGLQASLVKG